MASRNTYIGLAVVAIIVVAAAAYFLYQAPPEALETQLRIYGVADPEDVRPWLDAFEAKYPGTTVEYVNKPPPPLYRQLIEEVEAGQPTADVVMITLPIQRTLTDDGYFEAYRSPEAAAYPSNFKDTAGYWTAVQVNPVIQVYNPQSLSEADLPKTLDDLVDPKWKGEVTIHDVTLGSVGTSWLATLKGPLGEEKWSSFVEDLAELQPARFRAFEDVGRTVYEGEYKMGLIVYLHDFLRFKATGAPIERLKVEGLPVLFTVTPVSVMKDAENPVAAKRFVDFILSEEGQKLVGNTEVRIAARPGVDAKYTIDNLLPGEDLVLFPSDDAYINVDSYKEQFTNLFGG
ncbi:MAG: ABC transporter substrate-binding protein [Nitrososphaerales archaeon]